MELETILPVTQDAISVEDISQVPFQPGANVLDTITEILEPNTGSLSQSDSPSENPVQLLYSNPANGAGLRCDECGKTVASKPLLKYIPFTLKINDLY